MASCRRNSNMQFIDRKSQQQPHFGSWPFSTPSHEPSDKPKLTPTDIDKVVAALQSTLTQA